MLSRFPSARICKITVLTLHLLFAGALLAQVESGTFVGTVQDSSGAVVAGATVIVTSVGTNVSHKTISNEQGDYNVGHLNPGVYNVSMANCYFAKPHGMQHCYIPFFMLLISNALLTLARHSID